MAIEFMALMKTKSGTAVAQAQMLSNRYQKRSCILSYFFGSEAKTPLKRLQGCSKRAVGGRRSIKSVNLAIKSGCCPINMRIYSYEMSSRFSIKGECS